MPTGMPFGPPLLPPLLRIAIRNVWRNRRRSLLTFSALFLGIGILVSVRSLLSGLQATLRDEVVLSQTGALQVHRVGFLNSVSFSLELDLPADDAFLAKITAVPGVKVASPRISFPGMANANDTTAFAVFTGIDTRREFEVCPRRAKLISQGAMLAQSGPASTILSHDLARLIGVAIGERATLLTVDSYDVYLDLDSGDDTFITSTTVRFSCRQPGATTFIDLIAPSVRGILLNGRELEPDSFDGARITLTDLQEQNELVVDAQCAYMNTGEGLHRFVDPVDDEVYLYTQFETADARRMYACFEQPDLKATFTLTVTGPAHWKVVSNAPTPCAQPLARGGASWCVPARPCRRSTITARGARARPQGLAGYSGPCSTSALAKVHAAERVMRDGFLLPNVTWMAR